MIKPQATSVARKNLTSLTVGATTLQWSDLSVGIDNSTGWQHSGIAALPDGSLLFAHPEGTDLLRLDAQGTLHRNRTELTEMHCLTVAYGPNGETVVWAADNGHRFVHGRPEYGEIVNPGRVVALDVDGNIMREIVTPPHFGPWSPTSVAITEPNDPRSDIWVADGYGQNLIHRFRSDGTPTLTLDGKTSGTSFDCPHGILIRPRVGGRDGENVLYVADRTNKRIVVFDLHGNYLHSLGNSVLNSPSSMVDFRGHLVVTELFGALAVFHGDDYLGHLGSSPRDPAVTGWPNHLDVDRTVAPDLENGIFNSPHGITLYGDGLALTEWVIGGRVLALLPGNDTQ